MGSSTDALRFRSRGAEGAAASAVVVAAVEEEEAATCRRDLFASTFCAVGAIGFGFVATLVTKGFETRLNIFWFAKVMS
jgi:hypothetical protein